MVKTSKKIRKWINNKNSLNDQPGVGYESGIGYESGYRDRSGVGYGIERPLAPIKTIYDIFAIAGSAATIAKDFNLHPYTVVRWASTGIPFKYWEHLYEKYNITPAELYVLNKTANSSKDNR